MSESNIKGSSELQQIVLSSLLKDGYILAKVKKDIQVSFFDRLSYKLIYKCLIYYNNKYGKLPNLPDMLLVIDDLYISEYGDKEDVKKDLLDLFNLPVSSDEFIIDQLSRFIRRRRVEETLSTYLPKIRSGESIEIDRLGDELSNSVSIDLHKSKAFKLSDSLTLPEVRRDSIGSDANPTIIKSAFDTINRSLLYKGYKSGDVVVVVAKPGSGKTMFMVNELSNAALQGYNVLHLFIGDMTEYDGFIRYASNITAVPQDQIVEMSESDQVDLVRKCNYNGHFDRVTVKSYSASEISVDQMIEDVMKIQDDLKTHFDMIAVDYPDNLIRENDSMYDSGGEIYNKLSYLSRRNRSVIIAGSQPKQSYWNDELIPLNGCAESSKKQQVVDVMITLGRPYNDCPLLTGFMPKVRRGTVGNIFRMKTEFDKARMSTISEFEYIKIKTNHVEGASKEDTNSGQ